MLSGSLCHLCPRPSVRALSVGLAWLLGTVLYRRFILHLRGRDQLPSFSLPSLSLQPIPNPFSRWTSRDRARRVGSGYGRVATDDEAGRGGESDEEEGLVGRFGLDSDDDEESVPACFPTQLRNQGKTKPKLIPCSLIRYRDARALSGDPRVWRSSDANAEGNRSTAGNSGGLINLG